MVPKGVLHKRNGHRHPPGGEPLSPGDVIRMVHADLRPSPPPTHDTLKFAQVVGSERLGALTDQATREVDGMRASLAETLARTVEAFQRGELADFRQALDALAAQADLATRMVAHLGAAARQREAAPVAESRRRLVDVNALLTEALDRLAAGAGAPVPVDSRMDPALRPVAGDPAQLREVLAAALAEVPAGAAQAVVVETANREGAVRGEGIVRVEITRPVSASPAGGGAALGGVARLVTEHGGALSVAEVPGQGVRVTIELPAI